MVIADEGVGLELCLELELEETLHSGALVAGKVSAPVRSPELADLLLQVELGQYLLYGIVFVREAVRERGEVEVAVVEGDALAMVHVQRCCKFRKKSMLMEGAERVEGFALRRAWLETMMRPA